MRPPPPRATPRSHSSGPLHSVPAAATTSCRGRSSRSWSRRTSTPRTSPSRTSTPVPVRSAGARCTRNAGNGYSISSTSGSFLTTPLESDTGWEPTDFTHVGLLAQDASLFLTSKDSNLDTWEKWVQYAKDKGKVAVGGIGVVNIDLILHNELAEQAGYEIEYVPFNEEAQLITGLSSGSLDAVTSNPAEVLGQVESGDMNPLLFTGDEPMPGLEEVPTAEGQGDHRHGDDPAWGHPAPGRPRRDPRLVDRRAEGGRPDGRLAAVPGGEQPRRPTSAGATTSAPTSSRPPPTSRPGSRSRERSR